MNETEFKALNPSKPAEGPVVSAIAGGDRTLLYGYDTERNTWHLYQQGQVLHLLVYSGTDKDAARLVDTDSVEDFRGRVQVGGRNFAFHVEGRSLSCDVIVPNKRLYPEACDAEFSQLLLSLGVDLPFTTFNPNREAKDFHGWKASEIESFECAAPSPR